MTIRLIASLFVFVIGLGMTTSPVWAEKGEKRTDLLPFVEPNEEGLHVQPWFKQTFLN
ncbi:MAG: hypothetical protein HQ494_01230, partial [Rhodospirillales bacterium]|nr:hypothetical protein [Rhodospirillales bacterium]